MTGLTITNYGTGYSSATVSFSGGGGSGATATATCPGTATTLTTDTAFSPVLSAATYYSASWNLDHSTWAANTTTDHSSILAGTYGGIYNAHYAGLYAGSQNTIGWSGSVDTQSDAAVILGGQQNTVYATNAAIVGGIQNTNGAIGGFIGGGTSNTITAAATDAYVSGASNYTASPYTDLVQAQE